MLTLADNSSEMIAVLGLSGSLIFGLVWLVTNTITNVSKNRQREESRREVAAYVAEGSMSAADAERILSAGITVTETDAWGATKERPISAAEARA